jgi:hypothetical protein
VPATGPFQHVTRPPRRPELTGSRGGRRPTPCST